MSSATNPCCHSLSLRSAPPNSRFSISAHLKPLLPRFPLSSSVHCVSTLSRRRRNKWEVLCFRREESSPENFESKSVEDKLAEDLVPTPEVNQPSVTRKDWVSSLYKAVESIFVTEPWVVPWSAKTIVQVMLLWVASFWVIGSWIIPIIAHTLGYRKEFMTYRGQALYSLLTDVVEGLTGMAILHRCLSRFHPLPPGWFKFSYEGNWQFDVGLGCLMFPLVNRLSQVNLNLLPILPSAPVTVSSVEQSIVARDPVAMALYAVVVSVCAPIWEEIVFRGFLLPSLTKYMPLWCSILLQASVGTSGAIASPAVKLTAEPRGKQVSACSLRKSCRRLSRQIFEKYLNFLRPLCRRIQRVGGAGNENDIKAGKFFDGGSRRPITGEAHQYCDEWRRSCDSESSIYDAVLHCKRSIGK